MNNSKAEIKYLTVRRGGKDYQLTAQKYYVGLFEQKIKLGGNSVWISPVPSDLKPEDLDRARSFALECWNSPYNAIDLDEWDEDTA